MKSIGTNAKRILSILIISIMLGLVTGCYDPNEPTEPRAVSTRERAGPRIGSVIIATN